MTPNQIINEIKEYAGEWLETTPIPDEFISLVLARKVIQLNEEIVYLERRLAHECVTR